MSRKKQVLALALGLPLLACNLYLMKVWRKPDVLLTHRVLAITQIQSQSSLSWDTPHRCKHGPMDADIQFRNSKGFSEAGRFHIIPLNVDYNSGNTRLLQLLKLSMLDRLLETHAMDDYSLLLNDLITCSGESPMIYLTRKMSKSTSIEKMALSSTTASRIPDQSPNVLLLLYAGNCIRRKQDSMNNKMTADLDQCFTSNNFDLENDLEWIAAKMCGLNKTVITALELMNGVTEFVGYLSSRLSNAMDVYLNSEFMNTISKISSEFEIRDAFYDSVDRRLREFLWSYKHVCNRGEQLLPSSVLQDWLASMPLDYIKGRERQKEWIVFGDHIYPKCKLKNGLNCYVKVMDPILSGVRDTNNQGPGELVSHLVDLAVGLGITADSAHRRLEMKSSLLSPNQLDFDKKSFIEKRTGNVVVDFVLIGAVKEFSRDHNANPDNITGKYFSHQVELDGPLSYGLTREQLLDISDILIFDFIIDNPDRWYAKNWVKSSRRFLAFDNGWGFFHDVYSHNSSGCPILLYRPVLFYDKKSISTNCAAQKFVDHDAIFCRFNRRTEHKLHAATVGGFARKFKNILESELWFTGRYEKYFYNINLGAAIEDRIKVVLNYINQCKIKYGHDSVYI